VPQGWGHAVINLEPSVAVTQNLVLERDALMFWEVLQSVQPHLCHEWREAVRQRHPDLAERMLDDDERMLDERMLG